MSGETDVAGRPASWVLMLQLVIAVSLMSQHTVGGIRLAFTWITLVWPLTGYTHKWCYWNTCFVRVKGVRLIRDLGQAWCSTVELVNGLAGRSVMLKEVPVGITCVVRLFSLQGNRWSLYNSWQLSWLHGRTGEDYVISGDLSQTAFCVHVAS